MGEHEQRAVHCVLRPAIGQSQAASSRQRTGAAARAAICAATGASAAALPRTQFATLSGHRRHAPNRSPIARTIAEEVHRCSACKLFLSPSFRIAVSTDVGHDAAAASGCRRPHS